jgi:hypothetical protein
MKTVPSTTSRPLSVAAPVRSSRPTHLGHVAHADRDAPAVAEDDVAMSSWVPHLARRADQVLLAARSM